ncbi:MAG TPA: hypothetical protein VF910_00890 [Candidatus Bathyarchaeia archaeon]
MICPHCGQHITMNDAQIVYPGTVNPTAANRVAAVILYPHATNACAPPPNVEIHDFTVGG